MKDHQIPDPPVKFRPHYQWPKPGTKHDCPKCGNPLELIEEQPSYYGKPWWCDTCQWQYTEEDFVSPNPPVAEP